MMKDQAEGLRQLFAETADAPIVCLVGCPSREAATIPFTKSLTDSLASRGQPMLWIDEVDFRHREGLPLAANVRFQLSQWLNGYVALDDTVALFGDQRWYAFSGIDLPKTSSDADRNTIDQFQRSGLDTEIVVASVTASTSLLPMLAGHPLHLALVCDAKPAELKPMLSWISRMEASAAIASVSLVLCGDESACEAFRHAVTEVSAGFIASSPEVLGSVGIKLMSAPLAALGRASQPITDLLATRIMRR
jgi:hypothetical protein